MNLSEISTKDLVTELAKREGVTEYILPDPDTRGAIWIEGRPGILQPSGPARILVVID